MRRSAIAWITLSDGLVGGTLCRFSRQTAATVNTITIPATNKTAEIILARTEAEIKALDLQGLIHYKSGLSENEAALILKDGSEIPIYFSIRNITDETERNIGKILYFENAD